MKKRKVKHISWLRQLKSLHKLAWRLQSEYVRRSGTDKRGYNFCFTCGKKAHWKNLDCGHYIHRNCLNYDLVNLKPQCTRCNRFLHGNLGLYAERLIAEYGEEAIIELRQRANQVKKFTIFELKELIEKYTELLKEIR